AGGAVGGIDRARSIAAPAAAVAGADIGVAAADERTRQEDRELHHPVVTLQRRCHCKPASTRRTLPFALPIEYGIYTTTVAEVAYRLHRPQSTPALPR